MLGLCWGNVRVILGSCLYHEPFEATSVFSCEIRTMELSRFTGLMLGKLLEDTIGRTPPIDYYILI